MTAIEEKNLSLPPNLSWVVDTSGVTGKLCKLNFFKTIPFKEHWSAAYFITERRYSWYFICDTLPYIKHFIKVFIGFIYSYDLIFPFQFVCVCVIHDEQKNCSVLLLNKSLLTDYIWTNCEIHMLFVCTCVFVCGVDFTYHEIIIFCITRPNKEVIWDRLCFGTCFFF